MVPNCPWCQIVRGAKLSMVPNCPWCQIVRGAKLSAVLNCPGAKLSYNPQELVVTIQIYLWLIFAKPNLSVFLLSAFLLKHCLLG